MNVDAERRAGLLAACLVAFAPRVHAEAVATILDYGEYTAVTVGIDHRPMIQGQFEHSIVDDVAFTRRTTTIEARRCLRFGIRYTLTGLRRGDAPVVLRTTHPLLVSPEGQSETVSAIAAPVAFEPTSAGFEFSSPSEMVGGTWTFALVQGDAVLAEQSFDVTVPSPPKPPLPGCEVLTS